MTPHPTLIAADELPELPEPLCHRIEWADEPDPRDPGNWVQWHDSGDLPAAWDDEEPTKVEALFTADQMHAFRAEGIRIALEADRAARQVAVPAGFWLAPMVMDVEMIRAAGETPGMKEIDSLSQTMQLRGYTANPRAFEGGAPLAQAYLAMRDSWLARHPQGVPNPSVPLSAIRPIAVEAIRAITGCPDVMSGERSLVEELESVAKAAAKTLGTSQAVQPAPIVGYVTKIAEGQTLFLPRPSLNTEGMVALSLHARHPQAVPTTGGARG